MWLNNQSSLRHFLSCSISLSEMQICRTYAQLINLPCCRSSISVHGSLSSMFFAHDRDLNP